MRAGKVKLQPRSPQRVSADIYGKHQAKESMRKTFKGGHWLAAGAIAMLAVGIPHARAQDFFGSFFDALSGRPEPARRALNYGDPESSIFPPERSAAPAPRASSGRSSAYCVRTCDGRYFPVSAANEKARTETCNSLCPASETKVFYGSSIERATAEGGKSYSSLPNAFKYREQLVPACTCNGKDPVGLAQISIDNDPTIRKGDVVAGENGLIVATTTANRKGASANFSPAPQRIRAKFERAAKLATR
ncbi:MAG: DUF2865 domain-containing protein [Novosphingobium sp.]|nr:DUF2865 domain-containing protein [Novosphingobium sp.]